MPRQFATSLTGLDRLHEETKALDDAYRHMEIHHMWNGKDAVSAEQAQGASRIAELILNPMASSVQHESAQVADPEKFMQRLDGEYKIMGGTRDGVSSEHARNVSERVNRALPPTPPTA